MIIKETFIMNICINFMAAFCSLSAAIAMASQNAGDLSPIAANPLVSTAALAAPVDVALSEESAVSAEGICATPVDLGSYLFPRIQKVHDGYYIGKLPGESDIYLVMERITQETIQPWMCYFDQQRGNFRTLSNQTSTWVGSSVAYRVLKRGLNENEEKWVAYIQQGSEPLNMAVSMGSWYLEDCEAKKPQDECTLIGGIQTEIWIKMTPEEIKDELNRRNEENRRKMTEYNRKMTEYNCVASRIGMFVTVTSSPQAWITTHLGIAKAVDSQLNLNRVSMDVHSFAAKVMMMRNPDRLYMVNGPVYGMAKILENSMPKGFVFIGTTDEQNKPQGLFFGNMIDILWRRTDMIKEEATEEIQELERRCPPLISVGNPEKRKPTHFVIYDKANRQKESLRINQGDPHYTWLLNGHAKGDPGEEPYVAVDLWALANHKETAPFDAEEMKRLLEGTGRMPASVL